LLGAIFKAPRDFGFAFGGRQPPQVEVHGRLKPFALEPPNRAHQCARQSGRGIINSIPMIQDFAARVVRLSYFVCKFCRFRVNIYARTETMRW